MDLHDGRNYHCNWEANSMRPIDADKLILHLNDYALQESPSNKIMKGGGIE